jgi:hypothetical protein
MRYFFWILKILVTSILSGSKLNLNDHEKLYLNGYESCMLRVQVGLRVEREECRERKF